MDFEVLMSRGLSGSLSVPGDKSISHRAVIIGSLTTGSVKVTGYLKSDDVLRSVACIRALGVNVREEPECLIVEGVGLDGFTEADNVLDVGNSGTSLRLLPGVVAGHPFLTVFTGDESVRRRPMDRIIKPLRAMGAEIYGRSGGTLAPITVLGRPLSGIDYTLRIASAQVKSTILLAGLSAEGDTTLMGMVASRDHTERMLDLFEADIVTTGESVTLKGGVELQARDIDVPGDISSAAFFTVASAIVPGSEILLKDVGVNPTRAGIIEVMRSMGADVQLLNGKTASNEPRADVRIAYSELTGVDVEEALIPRIIDEIPILAVAASQAVGRTTIKGAGELRVKETDRISAICSELGKMGARVRQSEDSLIIEGPTKLTGTRVNSRGDHRMAMALAVAGLTATGSTNIEGWECVDVSYPGFGEDLKKLNKAGP